MREDKNDTKREIFDFSYKVKDVIAFYQSFLNSIQKRVDFYMAMIYFLSVCIANFSIKN